MTVLSQRLFPFLVEFLRPLAAFCLRRGVKIQDTGEALKRAFIKAAETELEHRSESPSGSRLAVMTGLHRRDVTRLWRDGESAESGADGSLLTRIIGQWRSDKRFSTGNGRPRILEGEGANSEFVSLIQSVSKDLNPYTVLFELERLQAVARDGTRVKLMAEAYQPRADIGEGLSLLSRDVGDLIHAVEENVFDPQPIPNLHIATSYDNISQERVSEIRAWFMEEGAAFHEKARNFLSKSDLDISPDTAKAPGGVRVVLGNFSLVQLPSGKERK